MTIEAKELLDKIKDHPLFELKEGNCHIYFAGGTALSYYLDHRISYDLDFICTKELPVASITAFAILFGGRKIRDPHESTFRIQRGMDLNTRVMTFDFNGVKVEFFFPEDGVRTGIIGAVSPVLYKEAKTLHIVDLNTLAKLKIFALLDREKSRDMIDAAVMLDKKVITVDDIEVLSDYHPSIYVDAFSHLKSYKFKNDESIDFKKGQEHYLTFLKQSQEDRAKASRTMVLNHFEKHEREQYETSLKKSMRAARKK